MSEEVIGVIPNSYELTMGAIRPSIVTSVDTINALTNPTPETLDRLERIVGGNSSLWEKKSAINTLWQMNFRESDRLIRSLPGTEKYYSLIGGKNEGGQLVWFTETPQIYPDITPDTSSNLQVEIDTDRRITLELPRDVLERIRNDVSWMLENQCAIGVSERDLYHVHFIFPSGEFSNALKRTVFSDPELEEIEQNIRSSQPGLFQHTFHGKDLKSYPHLPALTQQVNKLSSFIRTHQKELVLLYHSLEGELRQDLHPYFINRNILTFTTGDRLVALSVFDNHTVSAANLNGLSETALSARFRIGKDGSNDQDLNRLECLARAF